MEYTKQDVQDKAEAIRQKFKFGRLTAKEISQYESLPGWFWSRVFMSFTVARTFAKAQHFSSKAEFEQWVKPKGMPSNPQTVYKTSGWSGYGDFLGTGRTRQTCFMSFKKARTLTREQHFTCMREFSIWKKPDGMPSNPYSVYLHTGWVGWRNFLNTRMSFIEARALARAQHFTGAVEFANWNKPVGMPSAPWRTYKTSGWDGYGDFLGTGSVQHGKEKWMPFKRARSLARAQHFTGSRGFESWKKPVGMPCRPNEVYEQQGWSGMGDFLGSNKPRHRNNLGRYTNENTTHC